MSTKQVLCHLHSITHNFGSLRALDDVSLSIRKGDILAIVGENGAGKSTLMSALFGLLEPDEGSIEWRSKKVRFLSAKDAIDAGLGMVHQHFMLYPGLTVLENIIVGAEERNRIGRIDITACRAKAQNIVEQFGITLDLTAVVDTLPVQARQQLEIVKMLFRGAELIILDEPTAILTPQESEALFDMLRGLQDSGKSIIIITHKLHEVMSLSNRVAIMRRGKLVGLHQTASTNAADIARQMVDGDVQSNTKTSFILQNVALRVSDLTIKGSGAKPRLDKLNITLKRGEILGIAGVSGSGQIELVRALVGMTDIDAGSIDLLDADISRAAVKQRRNSGMAYLAEDRMSVGLALPATVEENMLAGAEQDRQFNRFSWLRPNAISLHARRLIETFSIATRGPHQRVSSLSGGNKQKVIVARELSSNPKVIIAENPCWGVDVGAIAFIHKQLLLQAENGVGILLVSNDLDELFELCDRIAVLYDGRIIRVFSREEMDIFAIGAAMSGDVSALSQSA